MSTVVARASKGRSLARAPIWVNVLLFGMLGVAAPAAYSLFNGVPEPAVHDEYSYLLGADTFARGRLTNPTPPHPEFFEAPHILVTPTYASKYPPGQAAFLALGQVLTGRPVWGVWIGCGFFAASLYWMLCGWTARRWASIVTLLAVATLGTSTYWAQSYWGGMVAASGSALLFGGLRRTLRRPRISAATAMGFGAVILANTRPYEGALVCVVPAFLFVHWLFADVRVLRFKLIRSALPACLVLLAGLMWMGMYNRQVTGHATRFPYSIHTAQYFRSGSFLFSAARVPSRRSVDRLDRFYRAYEHAPLSGSTLAGVTLQNGAARLFELLRVPFGIMRGRTDLSYSGTTLWSLLLASLLVIRTRSVVFLLGLVCLAGEATISARHLELYHHALMYLAGLPWITASLLWSSQDRWRLTLVAATAVVVCGQSVVQWWWPHYSAPIIPLVLGIVAGAASRLNRASCTSWPVSRLQTTITFLVLIHFAVLPFPTLHAREKRERKDDRTTSRRHDIVRVLPGHRHGHLVFVRYDKSYTVEDEWVYNPGDLEDAQVIFAHDLGDALNHQLLDLFDHRRSWLVSVSQEHVRIEPYPLENRVENEQTINR